MRNRSIFSLRKHSAVVGRAAAGIYAILKVNFSHGEVVVPANICPMAVYPIVYAGLQPRFCDVDVLSGNVTLNIIKDKVSDSTKAVVVPHMYGNPVKDIVQMKEFCKLKGVLLIEDCASAMGASFDGLPLGTWGDYAIFSTGHAKTLDLGGGGVVVSDRDLSDIEHVLNDITSDPLASDEQEKVFSTTYRRFLNTRASLAEFPERSFFKGDFRAMILKPIDEALSHTIVKRISEELESTVTWRRNRQKLFEDIFDRTVDGVFRYHYADGAVPWRFSFFVGQSSRQHLACAMLSESLPVSDWYPVATELFGDSSHYPQASQHGKAILNLPLSLAVTDFEKACQLISRHS